MHCHAVSRLRDSCVLVRHRYSFSARGAHCRISATNERRPSAPAQEGSRDVGLAQVSCAHCAADRGRGVARLVSARGAGHDRGSPQSPEQRRRMADVRARLPQSALQPARPDHARQRQGPAPGLGVLDRRRARRARGDAADAGWRAVLLDRLLPRVRARRPHGHHVVVLRARVRGGAGGHALLRAGQPRRRPQGRSGVRQHPRCPPLRARPQERQRGVGADHRRLEAGGDRNRGAARGRRQRDRRHRRRRVRRAWLPQGL